MPTEMMTKMEMNFRRMEVEFQRMESKKIVRAVMPRKRMEVILRLQRRCRRAVLLQE